MTEKRSKPSVQFEHPAQGAHHCSECRHFLSPHGCEVVRGHINAEDWCNQFSAKNRSVRDDVAETVKGRKKYA